jgi:hypothetical protein
MTIFECEALSLLVSLRIVDEKDRIVNNVIFSQGLTLKGLTQKGETL